MPRPYPRPIKPESPGWGPGIGLFKAAQMLPLGSQAWAPLLWFSQGVPGSKVTIHIKAHIPFLISLLVLLTFHFLFCGTNLSSVLKRRIQGKWHQLSRVVKYCSYLVYFCLLAAKYCWSTQHFCSTLRRGPLSSVVIVQIVMVQPVQRRWGGCLGAVPGLPGRLLWARGKPWVDALC